MAYQITPANINKSAIIATTSRYQSSTVIYYGPLPKITFTIYVRNNIPVNNPGVVLITPGWEYRPDLVSFDIFGVPDYWWKIMEINGIYDILDFKSGVTIDIPSISNL